MDDNKHWFKFFVDQRRVPLDKNTKLKREHHVKDNTPGFTADVSSFTGLADVIPDFDDKYVADCLGTIHGAPVGINSDKKCMSAVWAGNHELMDTPSFKYHECMFVE